MSPRTVMVEATWRHDFLKTQGVRLHYVTQGEGPLMLMLHGFPEFWYSWRKQIPVFAQTHTVVALDLRGYNASDKPTDPQAYRMPVLVEDIRGVVEGLGYDRCVLVGHDWGGAIAWNFANTHPHLLERLIILNLPHPAKFAAGLRLPQQLLRSWYVFFFQLPVLPEAVLQWNDYQAIATMLTATAAHKDAFTSDDLEAYKTAASQRGALTAMLNYYRHAFQEGLFQRQWNVLKMPTLMIWGMQDPALGVELTYNTADLVQNLRIEYIPDSSHWVQQEQPERVNALIQAFLSEPIAASQSVL